MKAHFLALVLIAACQAPTPTQRTSADSSGGPGPLPPTCDQSVDNLLNTSTPRYVAIGYANPALANLVDPLVGSALSNLPVGVNWPGATVTITRNGKLIFSRAYGYANPHANVYMEPDSIMRLASVSKPITAMAMIKLIHDGTTLPDGTTPLDINSTPFSFLNVGPPPGCPAPPATCPDFATLPLPAADTYGPTPPVDGGLGNGMYNYGWNGSGGMNPLLPNITVHGLFFHTAGWGRDAPFYVWEPYWAGMQGVGGPVATALGISTPATCKQTVQFIQNQPLQFTPGSKYDYSNIGYCVAAETIAELSGKTYEQYVSDTIFSAFNMNDTFPGKSLWKNLHDRETAYYDWTSNDNDVTYFPTKDGPSLADPTKTVAGVYGADFWIESFTGFGGWISSAIDMARFSAEIAHQKPELVSLFGGSADSSWPTEFYTISRDRPSFENSWASGWVGFGWDTIGPVVNTTTNQYFYVKGGGMPGTSTEIRLTGDATTGDDYTVTVLCNASHTDQNVVDPLAHGIAQAVMHSTTPVVPDDSVDLFPQYDNVYGNWNYENDFDTELASMERYGYYPVRIDGQWAPPTTFYPHCNPTTNPSCLPINEPAQPQYRARYALAPFGTPIIVHHRSCSEIQGDIAAGGQVISLQKFLDSNTNDWRYQAVISPAPTGP
jgi:CubicO group peptidase (beta-lactamase class C family)